MAKPIKIEIVGDASKFATAIDRANQDMGKLSATAKRIGGAAVKGLAVVGGAAAAVGGVSVAAAGGFEKSMSEVFTLLPGISGAAMDDMEGQVLNFAKEFGTLPDEVVPALYSALSAGVPADSVFDYMETATKLATGGVTDLETAVDGLSSVVNAYGADVITAGEASDIIFTAVKRGKTTVDEIASSISNVTPIASALGVGFDEVGAGLAVLTAQGVPTAQATTQLRSAMAELGKEGSIADKTFRDLTGISFTQFIEDGGDLTEGLLIMADEAESAGGSVIDMFGSVEAGGAVLGLTKDGAAAMIDVMGDMGASAGATDEAYATMADTMSFKFDQIKATVQTLMIQLGDKLMPVVETVVKYVQEHLAPAVADFAGVVQDDVIPAIQEFWEDYLVPLAEEMMDIADAVLPVLSDAFDSVVEVVEFFSENLEILIPLAAALATVVLVGMVTAFTAWAVAAWAVAAPIIAIYAPIVAAVAAVALIGGALVYAYQNFEAFRDVVDGVVNFFIDTVLPTFITFFKTIWKVIKFYVRVWTVIISTFVKVVQALWKKFGAKIIDIFSKLWGNVKRILNGAVKVLTGIFDLIKSVLTGKWSEAWEAVKSIMGGVIETILGTLGGLWNLITGALSLVAGALAGVFTTAWDKAKTAVTEGWGKVATWLRGVPTLLYEAASGWYTAGTNLGKSIIDGIVGGLKSAAGFVGNLASAMKDALIGAVNWAIDKMNTAIPNRLGKGVLSIDIPNNPIPRISRAMGGPASGSVLVGERGPEVVQLPKGSNVLSNHSSGGGAGGGITVNVQSNADPFKIASEVAWAIRIGGM